MRRAALIAVLLLASCTTAHATVRVRPTAHPLSVSRTRLKEDPMTLTDAQKHMIISALAIILAVFGVKAVDSNGVTVDTTQPLVPVTVPATTTTAATTSTTSPGLGAPSTTTTVPAPSTHPTGAAPQNLALKFDSEFTAKGLDTTTWAPVWFKDGSTSNGTINRASNVSQPGDGYLHLRVSDPNTGSTASTNPQASNGQSGYHGFQYTYGYAEARVYLPGSGGKIDNWPAWWQDGQHWPGDGELDVMEGLSGTAAYHLHNSSGGPGGNVSGDFTGWHTYGAWWQSNGTVTWFYDGRQVGQLHNVATSPMYLIFENSVGTLGGPTVTPIDMLVDYVRVWQ